MARIDVLPSIEIIRGLKGILDFYVWRGLPCVRAWPRYRPAKQTAASLAAALVFGAIVKSYSLLGDIPLEAYREDALDQPRTARDIMVTGVYGNLHEASMSDFLDLLVQCRNFLSDLTALLNALDSISADEIDVNVERSILPTGAATAAAQATQLTALQKIDDLQDALESNALERLLVRGMDQLFSYLSPLQIRTTTIADAASETLSAGEPPAGQVWIITNMLLFNATNPTAERAYIYKVDPPNTWWVKALLSTTRYQGLTWSGQIYLEPGDSIRGTMDGLAIGDSIVFDVLGHRMTLET